MTTKEKDAEIARLREENARLLKMLGDAIARPEPMPFVVPQPPQVQPFPVGDPVVPFPGGTFVPGAPQRCAFDGLPSGVYGLVCCCPKCSPLYLAQPHNVTILSAIAPWHA